MGTKTFNNVKINLTLKTTTTRANLSTSSEDLAVQLGKIKKWYDDFAWSAFTAPTVEVTGSGNAITSASWSTSNGKLTLTKGSSFSTVSISRDLTSGTKIGTITIDGTATDLYCQTNTNTDTKVTQTAVGSTYTNYRPLVIGASNSATAGFSPSTVTDTTFTTQAIYCQPASGTIFATKFDGFLVPKLFTSSTVDSTAGSCFFYGNNLLGNGNYDWIGIQGDSGADKFQLMPFAENMLLYRQNDNGGSSADWQDWISLLSPSSVTANGGITATITTTTTGTDDGAVTFNSGVRLSHTNSVTAVTSNSFLKLKYDAQGHITGSAAVTASDLPSHTHPYLPLAGGTMDNNAEVTIPNGSHSSKYTGFGMYHYIGAGNGWARGINVNSTDDTRIGSLGMYGTANSTEPTYAYFGKAYNDAWYELYKSSFRINDTEENGFQFRYKPSSLSSGYNGSFISLFPGNIYGYGIVIGHTHGGLTVVGGGESASAFTNTAFDSTTSPYGSTTVFQFDSEQLVLTADNAIWFISGANGLSTSAHTDWTDLKTALFDSSGNFRPSIDNKGSIGTSSYKWANMYATTFNGNLTGNVTGQIDVTTTNPASDTTYYGIFADAQSGVNYMRANDGFRVLSLQGTTSAYGYDYLLLGNDTASGITGNKYGGIRLYSSNTSYFQLTSGYQNEPTSFRFAHSAGTTGADFSPETTNKYDFGTSSLKWRNVYATTLNGELKGTISTTTTATTQDATNTSTKVATTAHVTNKLYLAGVYYNSQSDFASAPWGKVWEYNINAESAHRHISFILEQGYQGTNAPNTLGILMVHIATNASKEYNGGHVFWLAASSDLNKDDIAVTYQGSNACIIQIWIKTTVRYQSFHLHPLYSGVLGSASAIMGTYSSPTSGAANYAGTLIASSYTTLNNPTKMLKTIYSSRPTSANFESSNSAGVTFALATSSMTTAKPMNDGYIMNFEWDNGGKWGAQLFLPDNTGMVEYRTQGSVTDWTDRNWIPLLDAESGVGKDGYIAYPADGQYTASLSSVTGALVITLPFGMTSIMLSFIVDVYNYVDNTTVSYRVSGYAYASNNNWYNCTALCIGSYAGALSNLTVRFGYNGTKAQVQIGETTTVWAWPQVRVRNIMLGHSTAVDKTFITNRKNWTVSFVTTNISNVTKTIQNTHIGKTLAASATQTGTVGGKGIPVYLNSGTITACSTPASGAWWSTSNALVSQISTAGVLEIGRYIDLHATAASTNNFDYRFEAVSTTEMMLSSIGTNNVLTLNTGGYNQIRFKTTATDKSYTAVGIVSYPLSANGQTMLFQCGGNMVIGGGEFAASAYTRKDSTGETQVGYDNIVTTEREKLYLGADTEVQIIANAQNLATYSNNDHVVWKFQTTGQLITPNAITDTLDLQHTMINQSVRSASNCVTLTQWIVDGAASTTYRPGISFHNTGGDSTDKGAIILRPYHHNADPWGKNVGLYIGKGVLKLDGTDVSLSTHTHNYAASATAGGTAKASESWKFTHGNELNVSKLASTYHHCWIGYRFNTDGTEETGDSTYYINEWRFGDCKGGGFARIYPSAISIQSIVIQTGSSKAQKITLETLMTWLITTKGYIHSNVNEHVVLTTTFAYADNDILQFTVNGTNMELQLAGVFIEFIGKATAYNSGVFVLKITAAPTNNFTATSGYTKFYANHTAVYHCNGSGYSPAWSVDSSTVAFTYSQSSSSSTKYYPIFAAGVGGPRTLYANNGFYYNTKNGTTSATGLSELVIGNSTASGTAGNRQGNLAIYSTGAYYAQVRPTTLSANRTQELPDAGGEIMVRKRTIRTLNQGENTMLNGQMALYSASTTGGLGYVDAEITGLFTNWSVIMFAITGCGFGTAGSNKFGIHGIVPLDLTKRQNALSVTSEPIVACIQYNPSKTDGLGTVVAQYINDNKIRFSFNVSGPQSMLYVYGLY